MTMLETFFEGRGVLNALLYSLGNRRRHLDRAITYLGRAVRSGQPDPLVLAVLGNGLWMRYERTGDVEDLEAAIRRGRQAVAVPGVEEGQRAGNLADLAAPLRARFHRYGRLADIDEAVAVAAEALRATEDPATRAVALTNLAAARHSRYLSTADRADVLAAVEGAREAVSLTGPRHHSHALRLHVLAEALASRFVNTDDVRDLDEAVTAGRRAVGARKLFDHSRARYADNLGTIYRLRFGVTGEVADLDAAIAAGELAVSRTGDRPDRVVFLGNLAASLWLRGRARDDTGDLRRAVAAAERAVAATPEDGTNRPLVLHNLSMITATLYDRTSDMAALGRSEQAAEAALAALDPRHPFRGLALTRLAMVQLRRPDAGAAARANLRTAVELPVPTLTLQHALQAAIQLGELGAEAGNREDAVLGYGGAVALLPAAAWPGLSRSIREDRLAGATEAASAAAAFADPVRAVELLELARSVMWSQQLDRRGDLDRLRAVAPALADRLTEIRAWFERPDPESPLNPGFGGSSPPG
ncbi:hypothetical protein [Plantactinospora soyae]|uniref:Tetratricopeptide (TPR) repeat protein n=1 Tax=Plantactinospora soyae TaxID=1544732 RepID=A0A927R3U7_9ACTN|nr:hypothetical protein [Plantactinospora soyae]MBE1484381.1 tetratricopeptide (TPR) repeat protein [Plantactinospora soyae]